MDGDAGTPVAACSARRTSLAVAAPAREVTSAAVLGRPGEVEPVAAALALALRRRDAGEAATVAVVGCRLPDVAEGGGAAAAGSARGSRRTGFEAARPGAAGVGAARGRRQRLAAAARRVTLVGAPAVLAVTAPRNADDRRGARSSWTCW